MLRNNDQTVWQQHGVNHGSTHNQYNTSKTVQTKPLSLAPSPRKERPRQVVSCLESHDSGVRLAAARLVGILAKDALYSKAVVFPEPAGGAEGKLSTMAAYTSGLSPNRPVFLQRLLRR